MNFIKLYVYIYAYIKEKISCDLFNKTLIKNVLVFDLSQKKLLRIAKNY